MPGDGFPELGGFFAKGRAGEEGESGSVAAGLGEAGNFLRVEGVGYLDEYARAVSGFVVRAFRAPVFHAFQDFEAPAEDAVGGAAFDVCGKADAA